MNVIQAAFRALGGIHPSYNKEATRSLGIIPMPLPSLLRVPMAQHLGAPAKPVVAKGDKVDRGQLIGEAAGVISAAIHAPTSGTVIAVDEAPTIAGTRCLSVDIQPDGEDRWSPDIHPLPNWGQAGPGELLAHVAKSGIVGMGGAGFPTHVKLSPPQDKPINTVIINGAECEPYLTADHRLMVEHAREILAGARIIQRILGATTVFIAIEDNKPDAIRAIREAARPADGSISIARLKTSYPQGAEKQQIYAVTGRKVPAGGLPMDVGVIVENVATTFAIWDAVVNGRPLTERVTTVTGSPVGKPANVRTRVGMLYSDVLQFCGGLRSRAGKIIAGGPMMGLAQHSLDVAVTKTTSGILVLPPEDVSTFSSGPCISCGRCVSVCPMQLMPSELSIRLEAGDYEGAGEMNVLDCIECGCCAYVCPSHRPMVQHMRQGKGEIMKKRRLAAARKKDAGTGTQKPQ